MAGEQMIAPSKERIMEMDHEVLFTSPESIIKEFDEVGFLFFVLWKDRMFCCDRMNDWAFADVDIPDDAGNPNSAWKIVTSGFSTLSDALDFPVLDGKSLRERFSECRFFME